VQPEEVLELIGSAPQRYDTVRAALRYRGDGPTKKGIRERIVQRAFQIYPREAYKPIRHLEPDGPFGWRCRCSRLLKTRSYAHRGVAARGASVRQEGDRKRPLHQTGSGLRDYTSVFHRSASDHGGMKMR
jgi:hypothetical protein